MPTSALQKKMSKGPVKKLPEAVLSSGASSWNNDLNIGPKLEGPMPTPKDSETDEVKAAYKYHCEIWQLLLSPQDQPMLMEYCRLWVEYNRLYDISIEEGATIRTDMGVKMNPTFLLMLKCMDMLNKYRIRFGATPIDRNKIPNKTVKAVDIKNNPGSLLT